MPRKSEEQSELAREFATQMQAVGIEPAACEHVFAPPRRWRFDYAWPDLKLAVELDGFGHHKLNRYLGDVEKGNAAILLGWRVLHVTTAMVHDGTGIALLERALEGSQDD
ncbi:MAG: hypothetical protein JXA74_02335 [Anaerolineae bacterium]|nr:hypothetical protein [Anaerolineae bacterium]